MHDAFGLAADDPRRRALRLANPLSDAEPELRTSLLPGLLADLARNLGRGIRDLALFEMGLVFLPSPDAPPVRGQVSRTDRRMRNWPRSTPRCPPSPGTPPWSWPGHASAPGWWGTGRPADWADAVEAARVVARAARAELTVRRGDQPPWHPGRCAELLLGDVVIGHAGELHPRVVTTLDLPARTCAMELDLDAFQPPPPERSPELSTFPPVLLDLALVVPAEVAAQEVLAAVRAGAGELLESVRLFDVYADDERLGAGLKSLAFALRFRAPDRTLTVEEATIARDAAVARAAEQFGARLPGRERHRACVISPDEVLHRLAPGERAELVAGDEPAHPVRVDPGVLAQGPADGFAYEEIGVVGVRADRRRQQGDVGPLLGVELADDRRSPQPPVRIRRPGLDRRSHLGRKLRAGASRSGAPPRRRGPTRLRS